jgi:hypothetical protein
VISRVYFTAGHDGPHARGRVLGERIRIYIDDLSQPAYDHPLSDWRASDSPLTRWTSGALVSYAVIYFQDGPFEAPFGALVSTASDLGAGRARLTALRWLLADNAFEFANTLELQFEYGAFEPFAADHYAAVAFFYLR